MEPSSSSATTTSSSSPSSHRGGGRELQGPRPAPLRVRKDSHKIRKPPVQQVREPVIIYTVSPKVVHAQPSEFMSVVQRLTGTAAAAASSSVVPAAPPHHHQIIPTTTFFGGGAPSSSSAALQLQYHPPPAPHFPFQLPQYQPGGPHELSSAARLAAIEQAARSSAGAAGSLMMPPFPGILSPGFLPAIQQASFFSPPPPGAGINLFGELISPAAAFLGGPAPAAGTTSSATSSSTAAATQLQLAAAGHQNLMLQQEASPSAAGAYYWGNLDLFNNHQN
ncbi:unnamed protein product [Urochloa decumbens]|uniref:VQ domain-containing protein n=1 Tax=Urochloa decumbens TaxID=240449 RepID=A0ABC9BW05_9POAL